MSKIGKKPVVIPPDVKVNVEESAVNLEGAKGKMTVKILPGVKADLSDSQLVFKIEKNTKQNRSNWGTARALVQNAVDGLSKGFMKVLVIEGIGFRAAKEGESLNLNIGYSHPVKFNPPAGIKIEVEKNLIKISGFDKSLVGQTAASIRAFKKPEPYKGKGIRYQDEVIRRKAGKKVAGTTK